MNTKQNSQQKYSMFLWLFLALVCIVVFLVVFFYVKNTSSDPHSSGQTSSSTSTNVPYSQGKESDMNSATGSNYSPQDPSSVSAGAVNQKISSQNDGTHVVPKEPIEIEIPTPSLGDVEEIPNYSELLRLNDLQRTYDSLLSYLEELEEERKNNPSDQELKALIEEIQDAIQQIEQERESILNGDL
jgi:hypothetical protein